jgi:hypothetical protein
MTRKIQKGGFKETWMLVVTLVVPALIAYVGGEKLQKLMSILMILSGNPQNGGGVQSGGGNSKEFLIQQLNELKATFNSATDTKEIACVDQIISKLQTKSEPAAAPEVAPEVVPDISQDATTNIIANLRQTDDSQITSVSQLFEFIKSKASQVLNATKTRINAQIESLLIKIKSRYGFDDSDMECFRTLKTKLLSDFTTKIGTGLDEIKQKPGVQKAIRGVELVSAGFSAVKDAGTAALTNMANDPRTLALKAAAEEKIAAGKAAFTRFKSLW